MVPAQPLIVDTLVRCGVRENLDGIYSILPGLSMSIVAAAEKGDYALAAARQADLTEFLMLIITAYPLFPACTAILNARGVPGKVHPFPMKAIVRILCAPVPPWCLIHSIRTYLFSQDTLSREQA